MSWHNETPFLTLATGRIRPYKATGGNVGKNTYNYCWIMLESPRFNEHVENTVCSRHHKQNEVTVGARTRGSLLSAGCKIPHRILRWYMVGNFEETCVLFSSMLHIFFCCPYVSLFPFFCDSTLNSGNRRNIYILSPALPGLDKLKPSPS